MKAPNVSVDKHIGERSIPADTGACIATKNLYPSPVRKRCSDVGLAD
jgi:hypothetical protein